LILVEDSGQEALLPIIGNDVFDTEREQVAVTEVTSSERGVVRIAEEALSVLVGYTPNPNFAGQDTFTYTLQDTGSPPLEDTATVTVIVARVNDPPVVTDDVFDNVEQAKSLTIPAIEILGNDNAGPMEEDQLITIVGFSSQPKQGTVVLNDDGSITYTPNIDATGTDTLTYVIQDNGVSDNPVTLETVSTPQQDFGKITFNIIDANQAPSAFDDVRSLVAGTTGRFNVLENDDDDGPVNLLAITAFDQGDNGGTVTEENGFLVYTPDSSFIGTEVFTYTISDGELTDVAQVTVAVTDPNNSTNSSFSGSVYFDSDNDGVMGTDEQGIGGVVISLTGTDNNGNAVARQATTTIDGSYRFQTLPKGTYAVTQEQPTFLLDGIDTPDDTSTMNGNDSFSVTVGDDEVMSEGNMFAERGLSLQYSMLDSLSSERRAGFLTAVTNGQSQFIRNPKGWDDYSDLRVTMPDDDSEITILATDKDSQFVQVTVSATDKSVTQLFGREGDTVFLRIVVAASELDLQPVA
jgi:hypothetical protein